MANKVIQIGGLVIGISILGHLGGGMGIGLVSFFQSDLLYTEFFVSPWDVWYFLGAFFTSIIGTWGLNILFKITTVERDELIPFLKKSLKFAMFSVYLINYLITVVAPPVAHPPAAV